MRLRRQSWCPTALRKARRSCSHELTLLGSRQLTRSWPTVAHFRRRQATRKLPVTISFPCAFSDFACRSPKLGGSCRRIAGSEWSMKRRQPRHATGRAFESRPGHHLVSRT